MRVPICFFVLVVGVFAESYLSEPLSDLSHKTCSFACYTGHIGTDYQQYEGAPVYAAHDGYAVAHLMIAGNKGGNYVVLDNKSGQKTRYLHLKSFGQGLEDGKEVFVSRGRIIGYMGNTGGPWLQDYDDVGNPIMRSPVHLHFEAYLNGVAVDPYREATYLWLKEVPVSNSCRVSFDFASSTLQFDRQFFRCSASSNASIETVVPSERGSLQIKVLGSNPGVESPAFVFCPVSSRTKINFAAKVYNKTIKEVEDSSMIWIKDQRGRWDNNVKPVRLTRNSEVAGIGDYEEWQVNLSELVIGCPGESVVGGKLKVKQFSIELSNTGLSAYWTIDWVKVGCGMFATETFEDWKLSGGQDLQRDFLRWKIDPASDPQIMTPPLNGFDVESGVQIQVLFSFGSSGGNKVFDLGQVYWRRSSSEAYSGSNRAVLSNVADGTKTVVADGMTHLATAEIGAVGELYELRIDPINNGENGSQDSLVIKSVSVVRLGDKGWVSTSFSAVEVIRQGSFLASSYEKVLSSSGDTSSKVIKEPIDSSGGYPFQYGFKPVIYNGFKFNGLVFGKSVKKNGDCFKVLDTGSIFKPNSGNIFCVMETADISGIFQFNMVFYRDGIFWWQTGYGDIANTNGSIWPCAPMPIEADCFKEIGKYQVEAVIKFNGKEQSLCKRDLIVSSSSLVITVSSLETPNEKVFARFFDISGRRLKMSHGEVNSSGVIIGVTDKGVAKRKLSFVD